MGVIPLSIKPAFWRSRVPRVSGGDSAETQLASLVGCVFVLWVVLVVVCQECLWLPPSVRRHLQVGATQYQTLKDVGINDADGVLLANQWNGHDGGYGRDGRLTTVFLPSSATGATDKGGQIRNAVLTARKVAILEAKADAEARAQTWRQHRLSRGNCDVG